MTLYNEFIQNVTVEYHIWGVYFVGVKFFNSISKFGNCKKKLFYEYSLILGSYCSHIICTIILYNILTCIDR